MSNPTVDASHEAVHQLNEHIQASRVTRPLSQLDLTQFNYKAPGPPVHVDYGDFDYTFMDSVVIKTDWDSIAVEVACLIGEAANRQDSRAIINLLSEYFMVNKGIDAVTIDYGKGTATVDQSQSLVVETATEMLAKLAGIDPDEEIEDDFLLTQAEAAEDYFLIGVLINREIELKAAERFVINPYIYDDEQAQLDVRRVDALYALYAAKKGEKIIDNRYEEHDIVPLINKIIHRILQELEFRGATYSQQVQNERKKLARDFAVISKDPDFKYLLPCEPSIIEKLVSRI